MADSRARFSFPLRIVVRGLTAAPAPIGEGDAAAELDVETLIRCLRDTATHAWKAQGRLQKLQAAGPNGDLDRLARPVEAILDSLKGAGLEIKDHTGEAFDYGQPLKVVAAQKKEGITREVVAETIRPTLFLQGALIQQGEVIIDIPVSKSGE